MSGNNSIVSIDAKELSKPATALIEKIADGIGGIFRPTQVVRMARAQAKAELITAQAQIEIDEIQRRAMQRFVAEEARNQSNIEEITKKAIPLLEDKSEPEKIEDDWVTNFFEKARIVTDAEMQSLWSMLLAGESNSPGSISKRTVNLLADLDKVDAEIFLKLCGLCWQIGNHYMPLVFEATDDAIRSNGFNFEKFAHLESLGLIRFDGNFGFSVKPKSVGRYEIKYFERVLLLNLRDENDDISVGKVLLSTAGRQLARVVAAQPIDDVYEYVKEHYRKENKLFAG